MIGRLGTRHRRIKRIFADGAYAGVFVDWARTVWGRVVEIVKRRSPNAFVVLPKRWIVERTFSWLGRFRRLSKDYEVLVECSESMIRLAMIQLMVARLAP